MTIDRDELACKIFLQFLAMKVPAVDQTSAAARTCFRMADAMIEASTPKDLEPSDEHQLTKAQIEHMVQKFLAWKLPENFAPDGGISFQRSRDLPTGTNLFAYVQARDMVLAMLAGLPAPD